MSHPHRLSFIIRQRHPLAATLITLRRIRYDQAVSTLGAIQLALQHAISLHNAGRLRDAETAYREILTLDSDNASAIQLLGVIAIQSGRSAEAWQLISRAIGIDGSQPDWYVNLGTALSALGKPHEASLAFRAAIALAPAHAVAHANLGAVLKDIDLDEAIVEARRAIDLQPTAQVHSNLLLSLNYRVTDPAALLAEHREWSRRYEQPLLDATGEIEHSNPRQTDRRLRLGYISADFRDHPTAYFLLPVLAAHDRAQFEVACIDCTRAPDALTGRFQNLCDRWLDVRQLNDDQIAAQLRAEGIDILVDLTGHFGGNRLGVFARRPAPVQVSCIGYPSTTGLKSINYRVSDAICDPPASDAHNSEMVVRLPDTFWCYQPPEDSGPADELARDAHAPITFGSANIYAKITRPTLDLWGRTMSRVPGSRLVLQGTAFTIDLPRQMVCAALEAHGVGADRIEFIGREPIAKHLRTISRCDVSLDTFPFNGGTTTCHALWMGSPVVTLAGNRHASRMGASMLGSVGLPELVANSPQDYVETAVALANDRTRLRTIRSELRSRMGESPLMNSQRYTRALEHAFREMWRRWCDRR